MPISQLLMAMNRRTARRCAGRCPATCATATSSPWPWSCRPNRRFPDNWIYIHSPEVKVGRIQNFGSWSPYLVKDGYTCLGLEYFVFEGDETWTRPDDQLIEQARRDSACSAWSIRARSWVATSSGCPRPTRSTTSRYQANVARLVEWLDGHAANVHPIGRNGMHRYNNQDHSMYTAVLTAENIATGSRPRRLECQRRRGVPRAVNRPASGPCHRPREQRRLPRHGPGCPGHPSRHLRPRTSHQSTVRRPIGQEPGGLNGPDCLARPPAETVESPCRRIPVVGRMDHE